MSWVRLDDKLPHHPKVRGLGKLRYAALGLHVEALCYASEYLTDGVIPAQVVRDYPRKLVEALLAAGLWHRGGDGNVTLHDFLDYNPSRDVVLGKRAAARDRMNAARSREHVANFASGSQEPANARTRVP